MGRFTLAVYTTPVCIAWQSALRFSVNQPATALALPARVSVEVIDRLATKIGVPNVAVNPFTTRQPV